MLVTPLFLSDEFGLVSSLDLIFYFLTLLGAGESVVWALSFYFGPAQAILVSCNPAGVNCDIKVHGVSLTYIVQSVLALTVGGAYFAI